MRAPTQDAAPSVLMICPQFRPIIGGYERSAECLSTALGQAGLRVVVVTERREWGWPAHEELDAFHVRRLWCWTRRRFHTVTSSASLAAYLVSRGREFDVWHMHQYGYQAALTVAIAKLLGRPVVLKLTSSSHGGIQGLPRHPLLREVVAELHRQVSACIAVSAETRAEALAFGIESERVHDIPNGIDTDKFRPASPSERLRARAELGITAEHVVLAVGRLAAEKNPLGLLDAWVRIREPARCGWVLAIVGDGPMRRDMARRIIELGLSREVVLAGNRDDVAGWYSAADMFVIGSLHEGLSNSMLEAMASGIPVVSTRVSGSSILEGDPAAGLVVEVGDAAAMAAAISSLMEDAGARAHCGEAGRDLAVSGFSLAKVRRATCRLYARLVPEDAAQELERCAE